MTASQPAAAQTPQPWLDSALPPDVRAGLVLQVMTLDEKIDLVHGHVGMRWRDKPAAMEAAMSYTGIRVPRMTGVPSRMRASSTTTWRASASLA